MLHFETVLPSTLDLLKSLQALPGLQGMRLVGGTALALQMGHRQSVDLDLFGRFDANKSFRRELIENGYIANGADSGEVQTLTVNDVKVDLVNYAYPWLTDAIVDADCVLAGMDDIAAMKLAAVANRGKKKDFIDMAFLLERYSLDRIFELYQQKFSVSEVSFALRGLTYFDDAEGDAMPLMFVPIAWKEVKDKIITAVQKYSAIQ